jgi:hypothetical protein
MPRFVVVSAPVGGVCAARAKALAGHEPVLLERSPAGSRAMSAVSRRELWQALRIRAFHRLGGIHAGNRHNREPPGR